MDGFFNQNNWFYKLMGLLFDLVILNVVTLIISLPLVTAGSALTALHYSLWRMARNEEGSVLKMYFSSLCANFKQVTPIWLLVLAFAVIAGADLYFLLHLHQFAPMLGSEVRITFMAALAIVTVIVVAFVQWFTVLVSRYSNTTKEHLKNAALAAIGFFPQTFIMLVLLIGTAVACVIFYGYVIPFALLLGFSLPQYCCALIYSELFEKLDGSSSTEK